MRPADDRSAVSAVGGGSRGGDEVGDQREKHVSVLSRSGDRIERGDVYFRHSATDFVVSPEPTVPEGATERYPKETLLRVEVTQHHSACFITTATAGESETLDVLREFRDGAMGRTLAGRALVGCYYAVSPPVAATLARHPKARTTRTVRWLVGRCAGLARRRAASRSRPVAFAASLLLTIAYAFGLAVAIAGHGGIRLLERLAGDG